MRYRWTPMSWTVNQIPDCFRNIVISISIGIWAHGPQSVCTRAIWSNQPINRNWNFVNWNEPEGFFLVVVQFFFCVVYLFLHHWFKNRVLSIESDYYTVFFLFHLLFYKHTKYDYYLCMQSLAGMSYLDVLKYGLHLERKNTNLNTLQYQLKCIQSYMMFIHFWQSQIKYIINHTTSTKLISRYLFR